MHRSPEAGSGPDLFALEALEAGRAYRRREPGDRLVLRGIDATDLLHRIAASEIRGLTAHEVRPLLFTDEKGRVVDLAQVIRHEEHLELFCGRGRGLELRAWIERWIITEDVTIEEGGPAWDLFGPEAVSVAAQGRAVPDSGEISVDAQALLLRPSAPAGTPPVVALGASADPASIEKHFQETLDPVTDSTIDAWCARHGLVISGPALQARANPLELGWHDLVSWTKGCYIGQEIVARLDTYEKVRRHVVEVRGEGKAPAPGTELRSDDRKVGETLLATKLPEGTVVLALVDRALSEGAALSWNDGAGTVSTIPAHPPA